MSGPRDKIGSGQQGDGDSPLVLYSVPGCRFCRCLRNLLYKKRVCFKEISLWDDTSTEETTQILKTSGKYGVPQLFLGNQHLGGFLEIMEKDSNGQLDDLLKSTVKLESNNELKTNKTPITLNFTPGMKIFQRLITSEDPFEPSLHRVKMKMIKNSFRGKKLIKWITKHYDDFETTETPSKLADILLNEQFLVSIKGYYASVQPNYLYRLFKDKEKRCLNYLFGSKKESTKSPTQLAEDLLRKSFYLKDLFVNEDGHSINFESLSKSQQFWSFCYDTAQLQVVDLLPLDEEARKAFFLNIFQILAFHASVLASCSSPLLPSSSPLPRLFYLIGGFRYNLPAILHGILRGNRPPPNAPTKPVFGEETTDLRRTFTLKELDPRVHFVVVTALLTLRRIDEKADLMSASLNGFGPWASPVESVFNKENLNSCLNKATQSFLFSGGLKIYCEKSEIRVPQILERYESDFGGVDGLLKFILGYQSEEIKKLVDQGTTVSIRYGDIPGNLNLLEEIDVPSNTNDEDPPGFESSSDSSLNSLSLSESDILDSSEKLSESLDLDSSKGEQGSESSQQSEQPKNIKIPKKKTKARKSKNTDPFHNQKKTKSKKEKTNKRESKKGHKKEKLVRDLSSSQKGSPNEANATTRGRSYKARDSHRASKSVSPIRVSQIIQEEAISESLVDSPQPNSNTKWHSSISPADRSANNSTRNRLRATPHRTATLSRTPEQEPVTDVGRRPLTAYMISVPPEATQPNVTQSDPGTPTSADAKLSTDFVAENESSSSSSTPTVVPTAPFTSGLDSAHDAKAPSSHGHAIRADPEDPMASVVIDNKDTLKHNELEPTNRRKSEIELEKKDEEHARERFIPSVHEDVPKRDFLVRESSVKELPKETIVKEMGEMKLLKTSKPLPPFTSWEDDGALKPPKRPLGNLGKKKQKM